MKKEGNCSFGGGIANGGPVTTNLFRVKTAVSESKWGPKEHYEKAVCQLPRSRKAEWAHTLLSLVKIALLWWAYSLSEGTAGLFWNLLVAVVLGRLVEALSCWVIDVRPKRYFEEGRSSWLGILIFCLPGIVISWFAGGLYLSSKYTLMALLTGIALSYLIGPFLYKNPKGVGSRPPKLEKLLERGFVFGKSPILEHVLGPVRRFLSWLY